MSMQIKGKKTRWLPQIASGHLDADLNETGRVSQLLWDCMAPLYSLCSELLVSEMDVSRTKIHLDTSISATSNFERREYYYKTFRVAFLCGTCLTSLSRLLVGCLKKPNQLSYTHPS